MTVRLLDEKIEDISDLQYLKKYACPKSMHKSEWYLDCVECKGRNKCSAGKQAVYILNTATAPAKEEPAAKMSRQKQDEVEALFSSEDPIRTILESSRGESKSQSAYNKIYVWEKNYPELKEKYHMLDRFKFLFKKPYDRMTVAEVLETLYPKKEEKAMNEPVEDTVSLEDFLTETEVQQLAKAAVKEEPKPVIPVPPKRFEYEPESAVWTRPTENIKEKPGSECGRMADMLVKLENEKKNLDEKIQMINKQIEAIHIVQSLIG